MREPHPADRSPGMTPRVRLVGKPGCHLCDEARRVVSRVCADVGVAWEEVSILDDPELADQYWEHIPVTMVDGLVLDRWGVDERRLRVALRAGRNAGGAQLARRGVP